MWLYSSLSALSTPYFDSEERRLISDAHNWRMLENRSEVKKGKQESQLGEVKDCVSYVSHNREANVCSNNSIKVYSMSCIV